MEPIEDIGPEIQTGPFHERQRALGATFYEDMGWLWTRSFGDPVAEYWAVRREAGLWDVSALVKWRFTGPDTLAALDRLTAVAARAYGAPAADHVVAAPGTQILLPMVAALVPPGRAAVLGPTYAEHLRVAALVGHAAREVADISDLADADLAIIVNPNNPDGRTASTLSEIDTRTGHVRACGGWRYASFRSAAAHEHDRKDRHLA